MTIIYKSSSKLQCCFHIRSVFSLYHCKFPLLSLIVGNGACRVANQILCRVSMSSKSHESFRLHEFEKREFILVYRGVNISVIIKDIHRSCYSNAIIRSLSFNNTYSYIWFLWKLKERIIFRFLTVSIISKCFARIRAL